MKLKIHYAAMTWPEVRQAAEQGRVPLLPVGTIEQHGPHLPIETDIFLASTVCEKAARRVPRDAVVMPPVYYGFNEHHMDFPGTIAIDGEHFINYVFDIGKSLARHGFKKIVIVNGHGSNIPFLDIVARKITNETCSISAMVPWWNMTLNVAEKIRKSKIFFHADEMETSAWLYLKPQMVDMKKAPKELGDPKSKFIWYDFVKAPPVYFMDWFSRMTKTGVIGDPTVADRRTGKELIETAAINLAKFVKEFRRRKILKRVDHHKSI